jgi:hypothetical protein
MLSIAIRRRGLFVLWQIFGNWDSHEGASFSNELGSVASAALHSNKLLGTRFIRTALKIVSQRRHWLE